MFTFLVTQSLRNRLLVLALSLALIVFGLFTVTRLPVDVFPDLNRPTVTIMTEAEGLAPPEVEQIVTYPIETQMNGLPGVTYEQLERALAQFGLNAGGGFTDQNAREYLIRNIGRTMSLDDLRSMVVA